MVRTRIASGTQGTKLSVLWKVHLDTVLVSNQILRTDLKRKILQFIRLYIMYTCVLWQQYLEAYLRSMLVSEVVFIKDPPGDISVSTWQAMSLGSVLATKQINVSVSFAMRAFTYFTITATHADSRSTVSHLLFLKCQIVSDVVNT